jgi:F-type H+-transporting ATPase subunit epsilon
MFIEIITPVKKIYSGEVKLIQVPGTKGSFEILKNHAPLISTLEKGVVRIITVEDVEASYPINGGVVEVKENHIMVLAEAD